MPLHRAQRSCRFLGVAMGAGDQQVQAPGARGEVNAADQFGEEGAVQIRQQRTDGMGAAGDQAAGGAMGYITQARGHFADAVQGESVTVEIFQPGDKVKVAGTSIGKGFQGTIKRHKFHRGPVSHGSHNVRAPGSIGASATPSRVFKGIKMAGHMGAKRVTETGLTVHAVDVERNLLMVKGAVPGPKNAMVEVREMSK